MLIFQKQNKGTEYAKIVFEEAIEEVEKWSKIITFLSQKIIPICGVLSRLIPSYFLYFVIGLPGDKAFELSVPMW